MKTNKEHRNRQIRYIVGIIFSLCLAIVGFVHDYYEEEEHPRTSGFVDVNNFVGTHVLTKMVHKCDTFYNSKEEITIDWDMYYKSMMFEYVKKYEGCKNKREVYDYFTANCFLEGNIEEMVKNTIHQLVLIRKDNLIETGVPRYKYSLQVKGNIEPFTWETSREWTNFELITTKICSSCPNIIAKGF